MASINSSGGFSLIFRSLHSIPFSDIVIGFPLSESRDQRKCSSHPLWISPRSLGSAPVVSHVDMSWQGDYSKEETWVPHFEEDLLKTFWIILTLHIKHAFLLVIFRRADGLGLILLWLEFHCFIRFWFLNWQGLFMSIWPWLNVSDFCVLNVCPSFGLILQSLCSS